MKKSRKELIPQLIFVLFSVYVFVLGVFNIVIVLNRETIENSLANFLDAQKVTIKSISNLPLVFISGTEFSVTVNDELSLEIEDVYVHYRVFKILTREFPEVLKEIQIDKITFTGHSQEIKKYIKKLKKKFPQQKQTPYPSDSVNVLNQLNFNVKIKQLSVTVNAMTEFWHKLNFSKIELGINKGKVLWKSAITVDSIWSNQVLLVDIDAVIKGEISDLEKMSGSSFVEIKNFNFGGIPLIEDDLLIQANFVEGIPSIVINDSNGKNNIVLQTDPNFLFTLHKSFQIDYADFEEYTLLDYAFKPGTWDFNLRLAKTEDWKLDIVFKSPTHKDYGLTVFIDSIQQDKLYSAKVDLRTHYFGGIKGDLIIPIRKGLYPLPSGSLYLDNTRFILNGLLFSGHAVVDAVPNKNEMDITAFNIRMNNGLIGNTSVKFEFTPEGVFNIYPLPLPNAALTVSASIGGTIQVDLKALDVDGDFVAQNIKIPIFGIKDSRYRGEINMYKQDRKSSFFLNGYLKGFLDGEEQIDAIISLEDQNIDISRFYLADQEILLSGTVIVDVQRSNTFVKINAEGSYKENDLMPINLLVDVRKDIVTVLGTADSDVYIETLTRGNITDFTVLFDNYPLQKFGVAGDLTANLVMRFDEKGVLRFSIQEGKWLVNNRRVELDFDTIQDTNTGLLQTAYMKIGLDRDILDAYGYFSFLDSGFSGAFRFDRGGSFSFNTGRYIFKSDISIKSFIVDNIFAFELFDPLSLLRTEEVETVLVDMDIQVRGTWSDLQYQGSLYLESAEDDYFRLTVPEFIYTNNVAAITNLRLRHSRISFDSDMYFIQKEDDLSASLTGSIAFGNMIKTDFDFTYEANAHQGLLTYHVPNLYFLSKKSMNVKGRIIHNGGQYILISDSSRFGVAGSLFFTENNQSWDLSFLSDSIRFQSSGVLSNEEILAASQLDILLNNLALSGDIKRVRGNLAFKTVINGTTTAPIINGELISDNIDISLKSLRNRLVLTNKQSIVIRDNNIIISNIVINAVRGGEFGIDGTMSIQDLTIGDTDISFYSKNTRSNAGSSFLNWNLDIPYLFVKGKTYIKNINLTGTIDDLLLSANISTENLNIGLELDDTVGAIGRTESVNPALGLLSLLNLDIDLSFENRSRFLNQLVDLEFEQNTPISIQGNIGEGTVALTGDFNIEKGTISYLNTDLKIASGVVQFSGDEGDLFPQIVLNTEIARNIQNELIDVNVDFEGKLPNIELTSISSTPSKSRAELLNLIGFGSSMGENNNAQNNNNYNNNFELIASSVGIAENALFTAPLSRRIQRLIPFIDTFYIKTDLLGNLTRSANNQGTLSILHGSELEIGQYLPGIKGVQLKYNLRLESPNNTSLDSGALNQIHRAGIEWSRNLPYNWQGGLGANILGEIQPNAQQSPQPELLLEGSFRKRF